MRRPRSLPPALVAAVAALATTALGVLVAPPPGAAATPAPASAPAADDPLEVSISSLSPSVVPARGRVRLRGSVTNVSDERWQAINVHAVMSEQPMTSAREVTDAAATPADLFVGPRITVPGTFDSVGALDPGETTRFDIRLGRDELPAVEPGVYWFGAHALGNTEDGLRDGVADGRARTFLPLLPPSAAKRPVAASLVLSLRRPIRHGPAGKIRGVARWAEALADGGRLDTQLDLATVDNAGPLTWLVDPAVPDAVARLVQGNPPRSLAESAEPEPDEQGPAEGPGESPSEVEPAEGEPTDDGEELERSPGLAQNGAAWLDRLRPALAGAEVLALPYGDPDVAAVAVHAPTFYDRARGRAGTQLGLWQTASTPAVASPSGYLAPQELELLRGEETVIASDRALPAGEPRPPARIAGRRVLFASQATADGGPGPEPPLGEIALRQRILADAAVRLLSHDRAPLVVMLPAQFQPRQPRRFWQGLETDWLELTDTAQLAGRGSLPVSQLEYPVEEELLRLGEQSFAAAVELIDSGRTLESLLTDNDTVADQVRDEALTAVSYYERPRPLESRGQTLRSRRWIESRLDRVRIRAPRGVTLSSETGSFAATVNNRLPHPVTVTITTDTDDAISIQQPAPIQLAARGRQTVVLEAATNSPGVHYVRLLVSDAEGTPVGAEQEVPIRSSRASRVIWLILGVGVGLLFLAITMRVVRRVRSERT